MKNWLRRLGSGTIAALLVASLSGKAAAEAADPPVPEDPPAIIEGAPDEETIENKEGEPEEETGEEPSEEVEEITEERAEGQPLRGMLAFAAANSNPDEGSGPEEVSAAIHVGSTEVDLSGGTSGTGWRYEDGNLILVDYDGSAQQVGSTGSDITIKAAGFNRIQSLSVDGNLNLIGTGILLVDSIELAEGKSFTIQTNTSIFEEDSGSVAVFLLQEDGNYHLINRAEMPGLLDESYSIPAGVTLVIPDGSSLVLQSVVAVTETYWSDDEENPEVLTETRYNTSYNGEDYKPQHSGGSVTLEDSSPHLSICSGAGLIVESLAKIICNRVMLEHGSVATPTVSVGGLLNLEGTGQSGIFTVESSGTVTGDGYFSGSTVEVTGSHGEGFSLQIRDGSTLRLSGEGTSIDSLTVSGAGNDLIYRNNVSIGEMEISSGSGITCYSTEGYGGNDALTIREKAGGNGSMALVSGNYVFSSGCEVDGISVSANGGGVTHTAAVYDYTLDEEGNSSFSWSSEPRVNTLTQAASVSAGSGTIRSVRTVISGSHGVRGECRPFFSVIDTESFPAYTYDPEGEIPYLDYEALTAFYKESDKYSRFYPEGSTLSFLLEIFENGAWSYVQIDSSNGRSVKADAVETIRLLTGALEQDGTGGGAATQTNTSFTGTGILGGAGAGSVIGGNSGSSIFTGTGITNSSRGNDDSGNGNGNSGNENGNSGNENGNSGNENGGSENENNTSWNSNYAVKTWVETESDGAFVLRSSGAQRLESLNESGFDVRMDCPRGAAEAEKLLFAVFRDTDGNLHAFRAQIDPEDGKLCFHTSFLGRFVIVVFDWEDGELSEAFYKALESLPEIALL